MVWSRENGVWRKPAPFFVGFGEADHTDHSFSLSLTILFSFFYLIEKVWSVWSKG